MPYVVSCTKPGCTFLGRNITESGTEVNNIEVIFNKSEDEILELAEKDGDVIFKKVGEPVELKKEKAV